jgi:hypothetical protein
MQNDDAMVILAVVIGAVIAIFAIAAVAARHRYHVRRAELRRRFGPEYDRTVEQLGSPARAERELAARARRVEHLRFRELSSDERARFASDWGRVQAEFVDDPAAAVLGADALIEQVMRARGYPTDGFEQEIADLSVHHAAVVQHYRAARALSESARKGEINTEELRQAVVHYRALFADLLAEQPAPSRQLRAQHA